MEHGLLGEYFKGLCFHSRDQFKATWNESAQNIVGKAQSPADWCRTFTLVHLQMPAFNLGSAAAARGGKGLGPNPGLDLCWRGLSLGA